MCRSRCVRVHRRPGLEPIRRVVAATHVGVEDIVKVSVITPLLKGRTPPVPRHRQSHHEEEDVGQQAAGSRWHGHHGALHDARDTLALEKGEGPALREGEKQVQILEQLALLQRPRALEGVPPEADEELYLRPYPVLDLLERNSAYFLGPRLELDHAAGDLLGLRSSRTEIIDVHAHRDREDLRCARHIKDDVDEEDLEHAGQASRAEIATGVTV